MLSGPSQKFRSTAGYRTIIAGSAKGGACATQFDSIKKDFGPSPIPNAEGRRQTKHAGLRGTKIPCLQTPYNPQHFSFGNLPVAEQSEDRLRQLKITLTHTWRAGTKMTTLSHFRCSFLFARFSDSSKSQDAVSVAYPEV
jgi:hypothetical protein